MKNKFICSKTPGYIWRIKKLANGKQIWIKIHIPQKGKLF